MAVRGGPRGRDRKALRKSLGIPEKADFQARLYRWLKYHCEKTSPTDVETATSISLSHIVNIVNHPDRFHANLDTLICMRYGLDYTYRELLHEEPPGTRGTTRTHGDAQDEALEESAHTPKVRRARK